MPARTVAARRRTRQSGWNRAVASSRAGNGIGSEIIGFLKGWFTTGNKTGCRFIIVDAYNNPRTLSFYRKNGFVPLGDAKPTDATQLMYFDLITI